MRVRCGVVFSDGLVDVRLARKNSPEMLSCSQRTTTTFWPFRSCLATVEARRPRRWPLPSTTTCVYPSAIAVLHHFHRVSSRSCAGARKGISVSGMRTTGSKVDILLRLVRVVIDGLVDVVVVCRLLDFGGGNSVRACLGRCERVRGRKASEENVGL